MSDLMAHLQRARQENNFQMVLDAMPYIEWMGITATLDAAGELLLQQPFRESLLGNTAIRALHGGVTGSFLETIAIMTVLHKRAKERMPKIVNQTIDYRRPGRAQVMYGAGCIVRDGKRVVSVDAIAWQDDQRDAPLATASSHFLL
jgi:acyl-coenzyme A thioesterase PaaI-like protein